MAAWCCQANSNQSMQAPDARKVGASFLAD